MKSANEAYRAAASLYARANRTDPFAFGRMMAHLTLGIEFPSEVVKQWKGRVPDANKQVPTHGDIAA